MKIAVIGLAGCVQTTQTNTKTGHAELEFIKMCISQSLRSYSFYHLTAMYKGNLEGYILKAPDYSVQFQCKIPSLCQGWQNIHCQKLSKKQC